MILILDDKLKPAGAQDDAGNIWPEKSGGGPLLDGWLRHGVPGLRSRIDGDLVHDEPAVYPPTDPAFGLALLDHFDRLGWSTRKLTVNAFCPTGEGGGVDPTCSPARKVPEMPADPEFVSSQKANVEQNLKAVAELKALAGLAVKAKLYLKSLEDHPGTPSPKVQAYKQALVKFVQDKADYELKNKPVPNPDDMHFLKDLAGSTSPKLYEDSGGKQWVVKMGVGKMPQGGTDRLDHLKNEEDTNAAYRALGVPVKKSGMVETQGGPAAVSEYREGKTLAEWEKTATLAEKSLMRSEIAKHFVADALLANWDVVGLNKDNILVTPEGKAVRIDNGGGLKYRAQGAPKATAFGTEVKELDSLRDPDKNSQAAKVFGHLTDLAVKAQIEAVLPKREAVLAAIKDPNAKAIVAARFDWLKAHLKAAPAPVTVKEMVKGGGGLDSPAGLVKHLLKSGVHLSDVQAFKIHSLNPEGIKSGKIAVPTSLWKMVKQLKAVLPEGTKVRLWKYGASKLGVDGLHELKGFKSKIIGDAQFIKAVTSGADGTGVKDSSIEDQGVAHLKNATKEPAPAVPLSYEEDSAVGSWKGDPESIREAVKAGNLTGKAGAFMSAITKQPTYQGRLYRGLYDKGGEKKYATMQMAAMAAIGVGGMVKRLSPHGMSRSPSISLKKFCNGELLLMVDVKTARSIEVFHGYNYEKEIIGMPGTFYKIKSITKHAKVKVPGDSKTHTVKMLVHLEEQ